MSNEASTPDPTAPTAVAPDAPSGAPPGSQPADPLVRAFDAVSRAQASNDDTPGIAADDVGATSLAEELGADAQKP